MISDYSSGVYFLLSIPSYIFDPGIIAPAAIVLGLLSSYLGWRSLFRQWLVTGLPLSQVRSVAAGLVKLRGTVIPVVPDAVPNAICLENYTANPDNLKKTRWRLLAHGRTQEPFYLDDGTGKILVVPGNAEVLGAESRLVWPFNGSRAMRDLGRLCAWHGIDFLLEEIQYPDAGNIREGDRLVVIGEAQVVGGSSHKWRDRVSGHLRKWLGNPADRKKLDLDQDGYIDEMELEAAKEKAREEAARESISDVPDQAGMLVGRPPGGKFMVTKGSEADFMENEGRPLVTILLSVALVGIGLIYAPRAAFWASLWASIIGAVAILLFLAVRRARVPKPGDGEED
jgi:hypothetical protein